MFLCVPLLFGSVRPFLQTMDPPLTKGMRGARNRTKRDRERRTKENCGRTKDETDTGRYTRGSKMDQVKGGTLKTDEWKRIVK